MSTRSAILDDLKQKEAKATPGPWLLHATAIQPLDWDLIVAMRNALPDLLKIAEAVANMEERTVVGFDEDARMPERGCPVCLEAAPLLRRDPQPHFQCALVLAHKLAGVAP
jgi:hypothetical protein